MLALIPVILLSLGPPVPPRVAFITVRASGVGYPPRGMKGPQARLMADRAAQVVAMRNLSYQLGGGPAVHLAGFRVVSRTVRANGAVEITLETRRPAYPVRHGP